VTKKISLKNPCVVNIEDGNKYFYVGGAGLDREAFILVKGHL